MPTKRPCATLPQPDEQRLISQAIHESLCDARHKLTGTETTGLGLCASYAAVAVWVMTELTGRRYVLQAGSISILLSEKYRRLNPRGATHFSMLGEPHYPGGPSRASDLLPEFHCWAGAIHLSAEERLSHTTDEDLAAASELLDLASRHYPTHVRALDPDWEAPQDFTTDPLWTTGDRMPDWLILTPYAETTRDVLRLLAGEKERTIIAATIHQTLERLKPSGLTKGSLRRRAPLSTPAHIHPAPLAHLDALEL